MSLDAGLMRRTTLSLRLRMAGLYASFLLATAIITLRAAEGQVLVVLALVGAGVLAVVLPQPRLLIALLLGLVYLSSFAGGLPTLSVGGIRTDPAEALLIAALAWTALQAAIGHRRAAHSAFTAPLLFLALAFAAAVAVGLSRDANTGALVFQAKLILVYLAPLALMPMLRTQQDVDWFERCVLGVAAVASVLTVLAAAVPGLLAVPMSTEVVSLTERSEAQRLIPPAVYIVFVAFLLVVHRMSVHGFSPWRLTQAGLFVFTLGVSFFRSLWVPLFLCSVAYVVLRPGPRVPLRGTAITLALVIGLLAFMPLAASGALGRTSLAIVERLRSTLSTNVTEENSYRDRANENAAARETIRQSPVLGVGLGTSYGISRRVYATDEQGNQSFTRDERYFIHNTYLGVWIRFGLLGLLAFAFLGVRIARECTRTRMARAAPDASRALAAGLALVGVLLMSALQTSLFQPPIVLAAACALVLLHGAARVAHEPEARA